MLMLYLAVLMTAVYFASKLLLSEAGKPPLSKALPTSPQIDDTASKIEKLEMMLTGKNKNIQYLQSELRILNLKSNNFDKIKALWEGEIRFLREQNRIFRSELGLPAGRPKENPIT